MLTIENLLEKLWDDSITRDELLRLQQLLEKNDSFHSLKTHTYLDSKKSKEILQALHKKMMAVHNATAPVKRIGNPVAWWAAAACVLIIIGGYFLFYQKPYNTRQVAVTASGIKTPLVKNIFNSTDKTMIITLHDGSQINLYPNSSVTYEAAFSANQRNITLSGKAFFKVAKDAHRPFTVTSDNITTTALGTAFLVNMLAKNNISVKLYEGKVVIKSTNKTNAFRDDKYLLPGQELRYENMTKQYTVVAFKQNENTGKTDKLSVLRKGRTNRLLEFSNEPLKHVFNKLGVIYNVKILYTQRDINELFFTGTFSRSDNLNGVLSIICTINGLQYDLEGNLVKIKRVKK